MFKKLLIASCCAFKVCPLVIETQINTGTTESKRVTNLLAHIGILIWIKPSIIT